MFLGTPISIGILVSRQSRDWRSQGHQAASVSKVWLRVPRVVVYFWRPEVRYNGGLALRVVQIGAAPESPRESPPRGMYPAMTLDRQSPRRAADRILSIEMGSSNHAIVLNISNEGLGFHAINPLAQSGTIHFSFLDGANGVEASGELVWHRCR